MAIFDFEPDALIIAGFTGRNHAKVGEHIDEMRAHGVPIPDSVPTFYPVPTSLLRKATGAIDVDGAQTTGEVEPVLVIRGDTWYLTLGSDHTDRELEKTDIALSKAACPKVLCTELWPFAEVRPHWDGLILEGWAVAGGSHHAYQRGTCGDILEPEELVRAARRNVPDLPATFAMCMGTLPLIGGTFVYAPRYEFKITDPVLGRSLSLGYDVHPRTR